MRHPAEGTLRRLVDEPAGVADVDREHVAGCPVCLSGLAAVREDAARVGDALTAAFDPAVDADVDAAWSRLSSAAPGGGRSRIAAPARSWQTALRSPVVAAVGVVALVAGAGVAAAADWFPIFRTEQIAPVAVSEADLLELPDLSGYGDVELVEADITEVADVEAATEATGLAVPGVAELPRGVVGEPVIQVGNQVSAVFTFSAEKAARTAAAAGETLPPPPPGLDGNQFRLVAGPGVAQVWAQSRGLPALVVARAVAPTTYSTGIPFDVARDYLLSVPGLPENVAAQLRGFSGGTTLPLPVPAGLVSSSSSEVGGVPATVLTSEDGLLAGVVWVRDGIVTAVAGTLSADEVLSVARGLR